MKDPRLILQDYLGDMIAVEKHILQAIDRQLRDDRMKGFLNAYKVLIHLEKVLKSHIAGLDRALSSMGGSTGPVWKRAATAILGTAAGIYGRLRPGDPISRDLRDDYTALNLAAISYTMLHTTALGLKEPRVADLALDHLKDVTPFIVELSKIIPSVVAQELSDEGKILEARVGPEAISRTQQAWSHDVVG